MKNKITPYCYVFPFITELTNPVINLISVGMEIRNSPEYYYDNKNRPLNGYLFQYTLKGSGILYIGNTRYKLAPSQAFFIPIPGDTRYLCDMESREPWEFIHILIQSSTIDEYYQQIVKKASNIFTLSKDSSPIQLLFDIITQAQNGHITTFSAASSIAFDFINTLYCFYKENNEVYTKRNREIIHYIEQNFASIEGVSDLARLHNISLSHLSREFSEDVGVTPIKYLTRVRLQHAKKLLQTTSLSVADISSECGYEQVNYFCKVFKENTGQTPLQYRNSIL